MLVSTRGIVLHSTKYSDTSLIVKIYTELRGTQSFIIKGAFSKKSKMRASWFAPLSILHITYLERREDGLNYLKDVTREKATAEQPFDPAISSILLFYNELLYKLLYDAGPDDALFHFILQELALLNIGVNGNAKVNVSDCPIQFLLRLSSILGIRPQDNFTDTNCYFSIEAGIFRAYRLDDNLDLTVEESRYLHQLLAEDEGVATSRNLRNALLQHLIQYYIMHNEHIRQLESVDILAAVLH